MIEKLCPGLALCSVYKHLLLLSSSNIILPVRAALPALPLVWKPGLWSAHLGYCALKSVFYFMLNYDGHILVGTKLSLPLDTGNLVLVAHVR